MKKKALLLQKFVSLVTDQCKEELKPQASHCPTRTRQVLKFILASYRPDLLLREAGTSYQGIMDPKDPNDYD